MSFATTLGLSAGDRIIIGGDSGTHAHMWSHYFIAWLQLMYPEMDFETYEIARSGTSLPGWNTNGDPPPLTAPTVSEWERLHAPFQADLVVLMHGYNGGQTASEHGAEYEDFYSNWIDGTGAKLLVMGNYPAQNPTDTINASGKSQANATFAANHADVWASSMYAEIGDEWLLNYTNAIDLLQVDATPFNGALDGHYGPSGHILITWALLKNLGEDGSVSQCVINGSAKTLTSQNECTISNITANSYGGIDFERLDNRLPWAIDEYGREQADLFASTYNLAGGTMSNWQDYSLTVTGLSEGSYDVICNGVTLANVTHAQLAAGWNMAGLTVGPVWEKGQDVLAKIRELQGYNPATGVQLGGFENTGTIGDVHDYAGVYYTSGGERGATYINSMNTQGTGGGPVGRLSTKMGLVQAAAQPETLSFSIRQQGYTPPPTGNKRSRAHVARILAAIQ